VQGLVNACRLPFAHDPANNPKNVLGSGAFGLYRTSISGDRRGGFAASISPKAPPSGRAHCRSSRRNSPNSGVKVLNKQIRPGLTSLGKGSGTGRSGACLVAFDLLNLNGEDLRQRPLEERRDKFSPLVASVDGILFSDALSAEGAVGGVGSAARATYRTRSRSCGGSSGSYNR
jgi:hypothetical protein